MTPIWIPDDSMMIDSNDWIKMLTSALIYNRLSLGVHVFGLCATALITDILQLMTGLPTPYFLTVCKPNYTTLNITCEQNPYVLEDICDGDDPAAISQGR